MDFIMKKEIYDYMTPKEKDLLDKSFRRVDEIIRECPAYTLLYKFSPKDTGQSKVK